MVIDHTINYGNRYLVIMVVWQLNIDADTWFHRYRYTDTHTGPTVSADFEESNV